MFLNWVFRIGGLALISTVAIAAIMALLTGWDVISETSPAAERVLKVANVLFLAGAIGGIALLPNAIGRVWRERDSRSALTTFALLAVVICFFAFSGYFLFTPRGVQPSART